MYLTNSFTWVESGSGDFLRRPEGGKDVPFRMAWLMDRIPLGCARPGGMMGVINEEEEEVRIVDVCVSPASVPYYNIW